MRQLIQVPEDLGTFTVYVVCRRMMFCTSPFIATCRMTLQLYFCRFNLNVDGAKDDAAIWRVLEVVQMKETVLELPKQLGLF